MNSSPNEQKLTDISLTQIDRTTYEIWGNRYCPCYDVKKVIPYLVARIETPTNSFYGSNNGSFSQSGQWPWQEMAMGVFKDALAITHETGYTPRQLLDRVKELELLVRTANDLLQHHQTEEIKMLPGYTLAANLGTVGTSLSNAITGYFIKPTTPLI